MKWKVGDKTRIKWSSRSLGVWARIPRRHELGGSAFTPSVIRVVCKMERR
jgi:hypothetical protein